MRSLFTLSLFIALAVSGFGSSGCSRGGQVTQATREDIIGKWQLPSGNLIVEFRADGTSLMTSPTVANVSEAGQWEVKSPGYVRLWKQDPNAVSTSQVSINGDTLHVTHNDGKTQDYKRVQ